MNEQIKKEVKSLQIIYAALTGGVIFFILVTFYLNMIGTEFTSEDDDGLTMILLLAGLFLSIPSILAGMYIFNKKTENIKDKDIGDKLMIYRSAMIIRAAVTEGVCFFFTVTYLVTASMYGLAGAIAGLIILIWFFPSLGRLSNELKHNFKDLKYE